MHFEARIVMHFEARIANQVVSQSANQPIRRSAQSFGHQVWLRDPISELNGLVDGGASLAASTDCINVAQAMGIDGHLIAT